MARISSTLSENNINILGITMIEQNKGFNIIVIATDQDAKARKILQDTLVK
jgi:hypothetical protein